MELGVEFEEMGFRKWSYIVDSFYIRFKNYVYFLMKLIMIEFCKYGFFEDIYKCYGILRYYEGGRGRSNILDYFLIFEKEDVKVMKEIIEKVK